MDKGAAALMSGIAELADYGTRAAKAAALLAELRDQDVDLAPTPREEVCRIGSKVLYRMALDHPKRVATPVLVAYAMVGRWTILHLQEDRSFLRSLAKYNLTLMEVGQDRAKLMNFLRMEKWLADRPDHTAEAARQWLKDLYQENKLARGELVLRGRKVDLKDVTMPVLKIYSQTGHIIPAPASVALRGRVGTEDYTEAPVTGGHIGIFVGRSQGKLREQIAGWLEKR